MTRLSLVIFLVSGSALVGTGLLYLTAGEFMPYHAQAIQTDWSDLDPNYQGLFLGLLKGLGTGALIAGLATVTMAATALRGSPQPYVLLLPLVCLGYTTLITYATYGVSSRTAGAPPLIPGILAVLVTASASVLLCVASRTATDSRGE